MSKTKKVVSETIKKIDPKEIESLDVIPDHLEKTTCTIPIVVSSGNSYFCIDGWEIVKQAIAEKKKRIDCHVHRIQDSSEIELAIRKMCIRVIPQGGLASYAEVIRNVRLVYSLLSSSADSPQDHFHNSNSETSLDSDNREESIRLRLADRLKKEVDVIDTYLIHTEYLSDSTPKTLVDRKATEEFFDAAQKRKRILIKNYRNDRLSDKEITKWVSKAILKMLEEYQGRGKLENGWEEYDQKQFENRDTTATPKLTKRANRKPRRLIYWSGAKKRVRSKPTSIAGIFKSLKKHSTRISEIASIKDINATELERFIKEEIVQLCQLCQSAVSLVEKQKMFKSKPEAA